MTSTVDIHANLKTLLEGYAALSTWATDNFSSSIKFKNGVRELGRINVSDMPMLTIAMGDGANQPYELGAGGAQLGDEDVLVGIAFIHDDPDAAQVAMTALPDIVIDALKSDNTLSGACAQAFVSSWEPSLGFGNRYFFNFTVATQRLT